jgi:hypothetical protein
MTKAELIKALEGLPDDTTIMFLPLGEATPYELSQIELNDSEADGIAYIRDRGDTYSNAT